MSSLVLAALLFLLLIAILRAGVCLFELEWWLSFLCFE
jgi:hypothetical protein